MIMNNDTIAAISTGMASGGIGIIRISGPKAIALCDRIFIRNKNNKESDGFLSKAAANTINFGFIYDRDADEILDEVLVSVFRAPHTYTREDICEINCHGGLYVIRRILDLVISSGARPAEPGEFTKRAFLNGRIDLSEAEAVMDTISSTNDFALKNAVSELSGRLSSEIRKVREEVLHETAFIEAALDDPEHYSLNGYPAELDEIISSWEETLSRLSKSFDEGQHRKNGILTVIAGKPNVGKSSLYNLLTGTDRAIVTDVPGTTRDTLEEDITLGDFTLRLIDTAGIHETEDTVEKIGVERSINGIERAELVLFVTDAYNGMDEEDEKIFSLIGDKKCVIIRNKNDLFPDEAVMLDGVLLGSALKDTNFKVCDFSAKTGEGLDELKKIISDLFFTTDSFLSDEIFITNERQKYEIDSAISALSLVKQSILDGMTEDFFSSDLMDAYSHLGKILGEEVEDDLVDKIFKDFCMGK